jgi:hypothetical protein
VHPNDRLGHNLPRRGKDDQRSAKQKAGAKRVVELAKKKEVER